MLFEYLGEGEWCAGVPARDLTEDDLVKCHITEDYVASIVKPDGSPLYERRVDVVSLPDEIEERGEEDTEES